MANDQHLKGAVDMMSSLNKENNNPDIKMLNVTTADFTGSYKDKKLTVKELNYNYLIIIVTK
jgi:hypothetical protein